MPTQRWVGKGEGRGGGRTPFSTLLPPVLPRAGLGQWLGVLVGKEAQVIGERTGKGPSL